MTSKDLSPPLNLYTSTCSICVIMVQMTCDEMRGKLRERRPDTKLELRSAAWISVL
ncbi:hypothetical protein F4819DRAFT_462315 [Hypoxylon fuscum]|nr:hypothetical protein F4819DRAFT_462315 [Hypoxylon fuscum]